MAQVQREQLTVIAEKAVLVAVILPGGHGDANPDEALRELRSLAETAGAQVVGELIQRLPTPVGRTYLGTGKVGELASLVEMTRATLVIFDNDLAPSQIAAVEEATRCKVIDRSELILDIFANRAATTAAKLQVEIAQLQYTYPRLRAMWDHLGQVVGGAPIGIGTRGPGEKQLEIDRRLVQRRLSRLQDELEEVQARSAREVAQRNVDHFTVGLVGYTNAGKSTLFNTLTRGGAFADPRLFATLGTRVERWELGGGDAAMLSDTVGFIRDLPHHLVASFRSTLEETIQAQMLLVVLDASDPAAEAQLETVNRTLDEIGAVNQPRVLLLNKIDRLEDSRDLLVWLNRHPDAFAISAATGEGLDAVRELVHRTMIGGVREVKITVPITDSRTIDFLERRAEVLDRAYDDSEASLTVRIGRRHIDQLLTRGARIRIDGREALEAARALWNESSFSAPRAWSRKA
jgi:GTP-binding protein HflX